MMSLPRWRDERGEAGPEPGGGGMAVLAGTGRGTGCRGGGGMAVRAGTGRGSGAAAAGGVGCDCGPGPGSHPATKDPPKSL